MVAFDPTPPRPGEEPTFPPLLSGERVPAPGDPFAKAIAAAGTAKAGPGTVFWSDDADVMRAAIVLAPETTLESAMAMVFAFACGINDALGALAPPELAVHHVWPDGLKANGAFCGALMADADQRDAAAEPDWLVVGLAVSVSAPTAEPGRMADQTSLVEEGCAGLTTVRLIESWCRHTLVWINRWEDDGFRPLHEAWLARAEGYRNEVVFDDHGTMRRGRFVGLDETGDMLLETASGIEQLPILAMLDKPRRWPPAGQ